MWFSTWGRSFECPGDLVTGTGRGMRRKITQHTRIARAAAAVLAIGAVTAVAGCSEGAQTATSSGSTLAAPVSTAPAASVPASNTAWNPCSIPDADIAAAGLNPAKKETDSGALGTKFPGWDICSWMSDSWYLVNVLSTNAHAFDEVAHNSTQFQDPQPVTVGGRDATLLHQVDEPKGCTIAFDIPGDPVQIEVNPKLSADTIGDSCAEVSRIAGVLAKDLPGK